LLYLRSTSAKRRIPKNEKNSPQNKITLTIAGLLALAGVLNADPALFVNVPVVFDPGQNGPIGVAATKTDLIVTEYCTQNVDTIDCMGNVTVLTTIPTGPVGPCSEKYVAIAPAQSASATPAPFTPRDIFVTQGDEVYKVSQAGATLFATITGCIGAGTPHTGITFDHVGTFGYNMILTCETGGVWKADGNGTGTLIGNTGNRSEVPAVVPLGFGLHGGEIWAAAENMDQVNSIDNMGNVTPVLSWVGAEAVHVIPSTLCALCTGGSFFQGGNK